MKQKIKFSLSLVAAATMAACGGGGGGDSAPPVAPSVPTASCSVAISGTSYDLSAQTAAVCADFKSLAAQLETRITALNTARDTASANEVAARADLTKLLTAIEAKYGPVTGDLVARLAAALTAVSKAPTPTEVAGLNTQINNLMAESITLKEDIAKKEAAIVVLNGQITTLQGQANATPSQIATLQSQVAALNSQISALTAQNTGLVSQITSLEAALAAAPTPAQLVALQSQVTQLQAQLASSSGDAGALLAAAQLAQAAAAADRAAAQTAQAQAASDVATAQGLVLAAAADRAAAQTAQAQAAADRAAANAAVTAANATAAQANAARVAAVAAQSAAEAALATSQATIVDLNATITSLRAQLAAGGGGDPALRAEIARLQSLLDTQAVALNAEITRLGVQIDSLQTQLTEVRTDRNAARAEIQRLTARIAELQAVIAAGGGGNPTGLPFCVPAPNPIVATSTFPGNGTTCVTNYTDQVLLATAIAQAAGATKFEGVYTNDLAVVIAEVGGQVWTLDQAKPDSYLQQISTSNGSTLSASGRQLSFMRGPVTLSGSYVQGTSASLTYSGSTTFAVTFNGATTNVPAGNMGGQNQLGSMDPTDVFPFHNIRLTTSADGLSFTGAEKNCRFTGNFIPTSLGYKKVSITWGTGCTVAAGTVGSGVMTKYGDNYLLMSNQAGPFSDIAFVAFFNPSWSLGTAAAANAALLDRVRALRGITGP